MPYDEKVGSIGARSDTLASRKHSSFSRRFGMTPLYAAMRGMNEFNTPARTGGTRTAHDRQSPGTLSLATPTCPAQPRPAAAGPEPGAAAPGHKDLPPGCCGLPGAAARSRPPPCRALCCCRCCRRLRLRLRPPAPWRPRSTSPSSAAAEGAEGPAPARRGGGPAAGRRGQARSRVPLSAVMSRSERRPSAGG